MLVHLGPDSLGGGLGWSEVGAGSITGSGEERGGSYQEKKEEEIRRSGALLGSKGAVHYSNWDTSRALM